LERLELQAKKHREEIESIDKNSPHAEAAIKKEEMI
jgi:hypothetical protein